MHNFSDLRTDIHGETDFRAAAVKLLTGIASQILGVAGNQAATEDLARDLGAQAPALADAIAANTPIPAMPTVKADPVVENTDPQPLVFETRTVGDKSKTYAMNPWPARATAPAALLTSETSPKVKLDDNLLTIYAANATATYTVEDPAADPVALVLVPDSSKYKPAPAPETA